MTATARPHSRGFTLIELMIVVTIVGLLSTVALPVYRRATLRTRTAERSNILHAIEIGLQDAYVRGKVPANGILFGTPNPAGVPGPSKRHFDPTFNGWPDIGVVIEGDCFYTYEFWAIEGFGGLNAQYWIWAVGDLDGDGIQSTKQIGAIRNNGQWMEAAPFPADGAEDEVTFGSF
ncbi:MAG TPA: prepilin-type N-terminal cleavage/methylation domain-containing protein [Anaeromyxobacter sp.]|nr:prepilin-type N-terminal cleavage/methylation domain-containing protein [Anaeromyxobacter sp.]